ISFDPSRSGTDTLTCRDLQFDYSQVGGSNEVGPDDINPLNILCTPNYILSSCEGENICISIVNLFGEKILSRTERDDLSLELTSLSDGIYFAIITARDQREIRKIVVVH
ncbi:MAG: T9SS type A sorting domain-containing protein, partial [Ignavibacteriota bacterium]